MRVENLDFLDLNQENVLKLYKDCLIPKSDIGIKPDDECRTKIFTVQSCGKDSPEFVFSKKKIVENADVIEHWLGQLKVSHENFERFHSTNGICNL